MTSQDVSRWLCCQELAKIFKIKITLKRGFELTDKNGLMLGVCETAEEVYAFLCGYEHFTHTSEFKKG